MNMMRMKPCFVRVMKLVGFLQLLLLSSLPMRGVRAVSGNGGGKGCDTIFHDIRSGSTTTMRVIRGGGEGVATSAAEENDNDGEEEEVGEEEDSEGSEDNDDDEEETTTTTTSVDVTKKDEQENDVDDDDEEETSDHTRSRSSVAVGSSENAQSLRHQGKEAHDQGQFELAADFFSQAAQALLLLIPPIPSSSLEEEEDDDEESQEEQEMVGVAGTVEEYATCRLHQALCYLKSHNYEQCLETCSELLDVNNVPTTATSATTTPNYPTHPVFHYSSAIRARAYHRRAKARLGLERPTLALDDARAAAFLGDAKAVQLYGKLMRQYGGGAGSTRSNDDGVGSSSSSDGLLQALLSKSTSTMNKDDTASPSAFSPASLLFGGTGTNGNLASSLLDTLMGSKGSSSSGTAGPASSSLASSVLKSLAKRLDDPTTHTTVASILQKTTKSQLSQYSAMAGMAIPEPYLEKVEAICQAVTARKVLWTIKLSKIVIFLTQFIRRVVKILRKYRSLIVWLMLLQWTKSAILRPIPIDRMAAKKAARQELKEARKDTSTGKT